MGARRENYFALTEQEHNETFFSYLLPEINEYSRVVVVLRPAIVKNQLDEICLKTFRINDFNIIKV